MNLKRSLESRIRGWFPQEPYLISTRVRINKEKQQKPLVIPANYNLSATKSAAAFAIFWIFLYGFFFGFIFLITHGSTYISAYQVVAWIIAGSAFGILLCLLVTKRQLGRLSKDYRMSPTAEDTLLIILLIVLFYIFAGFVSWCMSASIILTLQGLLISTYSWGVSVLITRPILFASFEKRENMRIMQSWWGLESFLIPKPPRSTAK